MKMILRVLVQTLSIKNFFKFLLTTPIQPVVFATNKIIYKINAFVVKIKRKVALKFKNDIFWVTRKKILK